MNLGQIGRTTAAAIAVCALAAGCTTDPPPTPTPTATVSQTPTETAQERQERLDYAAAEKAYRTFRAEYNRVLRAGGAKGPTKVMKETAGGPYLKELSEGIEAYRGLGSYDRGMEKIVYVRRVGYSAAAIALDVCEDSRSVKTYEKTGEPAGNGDILQAHLELKKTDRWRVWNGTGEKVKSCN